MSRIRLENDKIKIIIERSFCAKKNSMIKMVLFFFFFFYVNKIFLIQRLKVTCKSKSFTKNCAIINPQEGRKTLKEKNVPDNFDNTTEYIMIYRPRVTTISSLFFLNLISYFNRV